MKQIALNLLGVLPGWLHHHKQSHNSIKMDEWIKRKYSLFLHTGRMSLPVLTDWDSLPEAPIHLIVDLFFSLCLAQSK